MRSLLPVTLWLLASACQPSVPALGGFTLPATKAGPTVTAGPDVLLDGTGARAGVGKAGVEMKYGSFKFTEGPTPWVEGATFSWTDVKPTGLRGEWKGPDGQAVVTLEATSPATGELRLEARAVAAGVNRLSLGFACADADHFLGFGAQADGVDHKGHVVPIWTSEPGIGKRMVDDQYPEVWFLEGTRHASSYGLPTWYSSRGYLGAVETDRRVVFDVCATDPSTFRVQAWDDHLVLWLFQGTSAQHPLTQATARVLGRPMRPPPLAFAPWNDAIFGPAEVRRVASVLRDGGVPSSVVWTEDFRGGLAGANDSYRLKEDWDLDPSLYPDAGALAAELKGQGFSWLAYFNTFLVRGNSIFDEATQGGHFVQNAQGEPYLFQGPTFQDTGLADLSREATREWVKGHLRKALDVGFGGWMADYGEWLPHDAKLASGEDALAAHNRYADEWTKLSAEVLAERAPDGEQRLFFARAGWLRSNEHVPVVWAGDQRTDFQQDDGLFTVLPLGLNLGLAGVSTFGHDLGGYQSATNPPSTRELFFRWTEVSALSPVMRTHHGTVPRQEWRFDADAETLAHYRRWAIVHQQLFPFFDAQSAEAEAAGFPIMRALALEYPDDPASWTLSDEYLLGGALLVAPVYVAGATSRDVHIPPGEWVSWRDGTRVQGPADLTVDAPLGEVPTYWRSGAVVPRLPPDVMSVLPAAGVKTLAQAEGERVLLVVPGTAGGFVERDGTRYGLNPTSRTLWAADGAALLACGSATQRGCVDKAGRFPVARLAQPATLDFPGGRLTMEGPALKTVDVEVLTAP